MEFEQLKIWYGVVRERLGIDELIYVRIQEDDRMSPKKAYLP